ncbi:MAG: type 2 isopentenyl-diphosphate Delta-isomerase [Candidatus Aenigmarchaeota archaeon]|nr:type 2 isopentenyl-diphosphate Delta-isomerase [Candidatus Aenigmarchaeota archaeon]
MPKQKTTKSRKDDHIRICLEEDVEYMKGNGFERYEFLHKALPEVDFQAIDCSTRFLGKRLGYPLFVTGITGGTEQAQKINRNIALACEALGIGFGVGSQRAMLEKPSLIKTYEVRHVAPNTLILGNIGAMQLFEYDIEKIRLMVKNIGADGLAVHLNPAQEMAQDEGDYAWSGVLQKIRNLTALVKFPVLVKEVGTGISGDVARQLALAGVKAIDVSGAGGTSWIKVDSYRSEREMDNFLEWGIPTAEALKDVVSKVKIPVMASGGIRNGIDVAKAIAMGSAVVGFALPVLKPATKSWEAVKERIEQIIFELKTAMLLVGAKNLDQLRRTKLTEKYK